MRLIVACVSFVLILTACDATPPSSIAYADLPETGDAERGATLFAEADSGITPCSSCHLEEDAPGAPTLNNYAEVASERVEGQDAREYTFYAITEPWQYIVEGYGNAMPADYDDKLDPQDIADLMAYLLSP